MNREDAKKILGGGATEEQITNFLNALHTREQALKNEIANKNNELEKYSDYDIIKSQLDEINKSKMTEQEKMEQDKKEIAKNLRESRIIKNKSKVMTILAGLDIDEEIIDSLVGEDENVSITKATKLATKINTLKDEVAKKTKEDLSQLDLTPSVENSIPKDETMNFEKFSQLSAEEQEKFIEEHPQEFENL